MTQTVKTKATVKPGGLVQVHSAELPEGATVEVLLRVVEVEASDAEPKKELIDFMGAAKGSFSSVAEIDAYIRQERDSWD